MTRETSIEAYKQIKSEGLLSRLRMEVYSYLFEHGPCTANQIHVALVRGNRGASGSFSGRLSELLRLGVVSERGKVVCPISGRKVILWDVTPHIPKNPSKSDRIKCSYCDGNGYLTQYRMF